MFAGVPQTPPISRHAPLATFVAVLGAPLLFAAHSLQKGQVIKQFFAFSISESLSHHPWNWLSTTLPCAPLRHWVEEPPILHALAGILLQIFPGAPALLPLISFWLLGLALFFIARELCAQSATSAGHPLWITALALASPIFLRYSIQHLPDLFATMLLCWGVYFLVKPSPGQRSLLWVFLLFTLATTAKALVFAAIAPLWIFFVVKTYRSHTLKLLGGALLLLIMALPFLGWLALIQKSAIPNPFILGEITTNRHSGSWNLLLSGDYYRRFFTWTFIRGTGLILFIGLAYGLYRKRREPLTPALTLLLVWALSILPYWLLVRQSNFVHDYYTLPFAAPWAILGAIGIGYLPNTILKTSLQVASIAAAIHALSQLTPVPLASDQTRPMFCDYETGTSILKDRSSP